MIQKLTLFCLILCGLSCHPAKPTAQGKQRARLLGGNGGAGGKGQTNGTPGQDGQGGIPIKVNKD